MLWLFMYSVKTQKMYPSVPNGQTVMLSFFLFFLFSLSTGTHILEQIHKLFLAADLLFPYFFSLKQLHLFVGKIPRLIVMAVHM